MPILYGGMGRGRVTEADTQPLVTAYEFDSYWKAYVFIKNVLCEDFDWPHDKGSHYARRLLGGNLNDTKTTGFAFSTPLRSQVQVLVVPKRYPKFVHKGVVYCDWY